MKRIILTIRDIAFVVFVILICGTIFIMSTGKHFSVAGYQVLRVLTSSMEPAIAENTCIIIKECPTEDLKVGDIITFTSDDPQIQGYYNTHRIYDISEEDGEKVFVTKGDAADAIDAYPVHEDQVAGIFVKELPGGQVLGKFFLALSDSRVYFLVIMLPLTLCLISYFWQIIGMITGRYDEDEEEDEDSEDESDGEADGNGEDESGEMKAEVGRVNDLVGGEAVAGRSLGYVKGKAHVSADGLRYVPSGDKNVDEINAEGKARSDKNVDIYYEEDLNGNRNEAAEVDEIPVIDFEQL